MSATVDISRRQVLKGLAATSLGNVAIASVDRTENEILELDCTDLVERIRDGSLRAEKVCAKFLQQYDRQRYLNTVTWIDPSNVLSRARDIDRARDKGQQLPPLAGLPILIKDNIDTLGLPTSAGTTSLKRHIPHINAPVVERLLQGGMIVMGKANMHELAMGVTSSNPTFGFVRNPYNPSLIPGGSSGGSAAAIAARIVPAALGTDTGGSVRIPAAFCGIVGFRPSIYPRKLYSQQGVVPLSLDLDTIGPMARSVGDVAMLHATIVGQRRMAPSALEGARIGVPRSAYWNDVDLEVERVAQAGLTRLRDQGAVLVDVDLREVKRTALRIFNQMFSRMITDLGNFLHTQVPSVSLRELTEQLVSRDVRAGIEAVNQSFARNARDAGRDAVCAEYCAVLRKHGIQSVVFPTEVLSPPPIRIAGDDADETIEFNGRVVSQHVTVARNTISAASLGAPALSLPVGLTREGLPVGLEFDGMPGDDSALLALGQSIEAAIGRVRGPSLVVQKSTADL